jgi:hypothetical protein
VAEFASETFAWRLASGRPSPHLVKAALRAGAVIDRYGSPLPGARLEYLLYPSDALFPPDDLLVGQRLLSDCGLLDEMSDGLIPTDSLRALLALEPARAAELLFEIASRRLGVPPSEIEEISPAEAAEFDPERRERLLLARRLTFDQTQASELGLRGEEHVVEVARADLVGLGRADLADRVQRLSELSDQLGYDVVAPTLNGMRRLEVKTSGRTAVEPFHLFLSRLEFEVGMADPSWALVACRVDSDDVVEVVGWCRATAIEPLLPSDTPTAHWVTIEISLPLAELAPGLPSAV